MKREYILIAEDDEDDVMLLKSAFSEVDNSRELVFVENGLELLRYFERIDQGQQGDLPSLLIVDLNMPKKNGREALSELTGKKYFKEFPTVIFSTTGNETEKKKCRELGVNEYFVKPSDYSGLIRIVSAFRELADN